MPPLHDVIPWFDVRLYGADPTGVADSTAAIQAAIDDAATTGVWATVFIPAGEYTFTQLKLKSRVCLMGQGHKTNLTQKANSNFHGIVLNSATVDKASVRSLRLAGNRANQTALNDGIHLDATGSTFTDFDGGDNAITLWDVWLVEWKHNGVWVNQDCRDLQAYRVHVNRCGHAAGGAAYGFGFEVYCTDSVFVGCVAGGCAESGWRCEAYNTKFIGCKGFGNGTCTEVASDGFEIVGNSMQFSACEAQDNLRHGFVFNGATYCTAVGLVADSNGIDEANQNGVAYFFYGSNTFCQCIGTASNRVGVPNPCTDPPQNSVTPTEYALQISSGTTDCFISIQATGMGTGLIDGNPDGNIVILNGDHLFIPIVSSVPAAGATQNGRLMIHDAGSGTRYLVAYSGAARYRAAITSF